MNRGKAGYFLIQFFENQKFKYILILCIKKCLLKRYNQQNIRSQLIFLTIETNQCIYKYKQILVFLSYTVDIINFKRI